MSSIFSIYLSGEKVSGVSQSSGSLRNFLILLMAIVPSGMTCPDGRVTCMIYLKIYEEYYVSFHLFYNPVLD